MVDHRISQVEPVILAIEVAHRYLHASARLPLTRHGNRHRFHQHLNWQSRGNLSRQTNLIAAFEEKANAKQELMVTIERNSKRNEETVSHLAEEIQKQHADIARTRTELLELAGSLSKLKGFVVEAADQCRRCTATTENTMKQASELLEASAGQLKECEDALQNTQETQVGQEELARRIKEHLKQADSYRLQLKSFALKTEVHVAKFQQGSRSFLGRLRWLFRGVSE